MKNIKQKIVYLLAIGMGIFLLFFVISCSWIGFSVSKHCQDAMADYDGDCVEALISLVNDEGRGFEARNSAVWALGQIGDEKALPVLESYYTGNIPDREPLGETLSQYELKKAINLLSGGTNISAIVWRHTGVIY